MATRRRDVLPSKEKATSSPQTPKLTTNASTAPKKPTPKTATINVSKKPVSANKPSQPKPKPKPSLNKTVAASPKHVQKTRVASSAAPPRSSSLPAKTTSSSQTKSLPTVSNARRSSIGLKKKEAGTSTSSRKQQQQKQITSVTVDKVEDLSMYYVPEPEIQLKDIEDSYLAEAEDKIVQSLSSVEKGNTNVLATEIDQQPLNSAKIGDEIDPVDPTVSEQNAEKLEKEVKVEAKQEEEAVVSKDNDECKDIKRPVVEKKKEILFLPKKQEKIHGKFESPVSNSVIEEAADKLLEQRRNKVRALAGAFETVISLQEM